MLSSIQQYWNRRAPSYTEVILKNLAGQWESVWANELIRNFPEGNVSLLQCGKFVVIRIIDQR